MHICGRSSPRVRNCRAQQPRFYTRFLYMYMYNLCTNTMYKVHNYTCKYLNDSKSRCLQAILHNCVCTSTCCHIRVEPAVEAVAFDVISHLVFETKTHHTQTRVYNVNISGITSQQVPPTTALHRSRCPRLHVFRHHHSALTQPPAESALRQPKYLLLHVRISRAK